MSETANPNREQPMWIKRNFRFDSFSRELFYRLNGEEKFVARFKYRRSPFSVSVFKKELIKNHEPSKYFSAIKNQGPLDVLADANPDWAEEILGLPWKRVSNSVFTATFK